MQLDADGGFETESRLTDERSQAARPQDRRIFMYQKHRYFIFDLDGTLAYTIDDLREAMNKMLRFYGWREVTVDDTLKNINNGARVFVQGCMPEEFRGNERLVDEAYAKYSEFYAGCYLHTTRLYPAVAGGISYLKSKGARIGVFSNKQDAQTKAICEKLFPAGTFEIVLGHSGEFPHKPSPEGALHIAKVLGGRPDETVVVGDSDVDMRLAKNGGFHPVGVSWGYRPKELLSELGAEMIIEDETGFEGLI